MGDSLIRLTVGWPLPSLEGEVVASMWGGQSQMRSEQTLWHVAGVSLNGPPGAGAGTRYSIPLAFQYKQACANAVCFMVAAVAVASIVAGSVRQYRAIRGRCPMCAYPTRSGLCPECGFSGRGRDQDCFGPPVSTRTQCPCDRWGQTEGATLDSRILDGPSTTVCPLHESHLQS